MRGLLMKGAKLRFALWALGKALPEPALIKPALNQAIVLVIAAGACGMLAACGLIMGVVAVYFYFMNWTGEWIPAIWLATGTAFLLALVLWAAVKQAISKSSELPNSLKLFSGKGQNVVDDAWNTALAGFLEGICGPGQDETPIKDAHLTPNPTVTPESENTAANTNARKIA